MKVLVFLLALISAGPVFAVDFAVDLDVFYFNDAFASSGTTNTYSRVMWDIAPLVGLNKNATFLMGWNYDSMAFVDSPGGTATNLNVTDMGPKFVYNFDKKHTWILAFTYNLITKANYSSGAATAELRGSSMKAELGYMPELFEHVFIGAKLHYYKATFSEQVVSTTLTKVTDGRTVIYPTFSLTYRF